MAMTVKDNLAHIDGRQQLNTRMNGVRCESRHYTLILHEFIDYIFENFDFVEVPCILCIARCKKLG